VARHGGFSSVEQTELKGTQSEQGTARLRRDLGTMYTGLDLAVLQGPLQQEPDVTRNR
jgi:hypothetical protein